MRLAEKNVIQFCLILLLHCIRTEAIVCYDCNSEYDPRCGDPFNPYSIGKINCSLRMELDHLQGIKPTLCRKSVQTIYGQKRVIRGCGYLESEHDDKACTRHSGTRDVSVIHCSCKSKDECNGSESLHEGLQWQYVSKFIYIMMYHTVFILALGIY